MSDDVRSWLPEVEPEALPPELRKARVRYRCVDKEGGALDLILSEGRLRAAEDEGAPDVVLRVSAGTPVEFIVGRRNLLTAVMRGEVELEGDVAAASFLHTYSRYLRGAEGEA